MTDNRTVEERLEAALDKAQTMMLEARGRNPVCPWCGKDACGYECPMLVFFAECKDL